jgi:hypothetical protein
VLHSDLKDRLLAWLLFAGMLGFAAWSWGLRANELLLPPLILANLLGFAAWTWGVRCGVLWLWRRFATLPTQN